MDKEKLFDSIDGLFAYDSGCVDSGIHDESLRQEIKDYLDNLSDDNFRIILTEYIRKYFVSEEAVEKKYGIEDVANFIRWLEEYMSISL
jgi:hypothetical protein